MTSLPTPWNSFDTWPEEKVALFLSELQAEQKRRAERNRLASYLPYPKQREFHEAGASHRERLFMAANQSGKTIAGGYEAAMHLTGVYPPWWTGKRWDRPVSGWAGGPTGLSVRDSVQKILLGPPEDFGTGAIPHECIVKPSTSRGAAEAIDTVTVRHVSGGLSRLAFKSYESGREKWQAATLDFVWFDEEPDPDIYSEGLTRTNATGGVVWMTFTPLRGMSTVVMRFVEEQSPDRVVVTMTIDDALHYTDAQREQIIASYAPHEREARARGVPTLGKGRIFPVPEDMIACDPVHPDSIPDHWQRIGGMDFGWDHPYSAVSILYDPEGDICYVTNSYQVKEQTPIIHAAALKRWAETKWMPWAWPHDGFQHDKISGLQLADQYREQGLILLADRAQFVDGTSGVEAGLSMMLQRMQTGRLKVYRHLSDWFREFRLYHRDEKTGRPVKTFDDLLDATRYGLMSLHNALTPPARALGRYERYGTKTRTTSWMGA
jgi:phage terminase large subunit-like protein